MRNLKTIENRVLSVLKEHPEARNDDMKLYLLVSKACIYDTHGISRFSFEDVMSNYKAYGIPCFESIRRTRQKIQAKYPELGCSPEVRRASVFALLARNKRIFVFKEIKYMLIMMRNIF